MTNGTPGNQTDAEHEDQDSEPTMNAPGDAQPNADVTGGDPAETGSTGTS